VLHGTDWASITGAGLIRHRGELLLSLDHQPLILYFRGLSEGPEDLVDDVFDEILPDPVYCRLWLQVVTDSRHVSRLDRRLLIGLGAYDFRRAEMMCEIFDVQGEAGETSSARHVPRGESR
jgi:hypothetical protein